MNWLLSIILVLAAVANPKALNPVITQDYNLVKPMENLLPQLDSLSVNLNRLGDKLENYEKAK